MRKFLAILISLITLIGASLGIFTAVKSTNWYKDKFNKSSEIVEDSSTSTPSEDTGDVIDYESAYNKLIEDANGYTIKYERTTYNIDFIKENEYCRTVKIDKFLDGFSSLMSLDNDSLDFIKKVVNKELLISTFYEEEIYTISNGLITNTNKIPTKFYDLNNYNFSYDSEIINLSNLDLENYNYNNAGECYFSYLVDLVINENNIYITFDFLLADSYDTISNYFNNL